MKKNNLTRQISIVAFSLSITATTLLATPGLALAAVATPTPVVSNDSSLTTTAIPPRLEITGNPGQTIQKTIKVQNTSGSTQYYSSDAEDFIVASDGKTPMPISNTAALSSRYSLAQWVTLSPTRFTLKSNETQVMDVLIQIPKDALPGGHYAMVLHGPATPVHNPGEALLAQGSTGVAMRVGTLMYLTVAGPVHEEAYIRNFTSPSFSEYGPVNLKYDVENRSDIHIRPQSSIEIRDMFGRLVKTIVVDQFNIFPLTSRSFAAAYGNYWGLGRYTAKLIVPYGEHGNVLTAALFFWIIPYHVIAGILVLIASVVAIAILLRRYALHHSDAKQQEIAALKKQVEDLKQEKLNQ